MNTPKMSPMESKRMFLSLVNKYIKREGIDELISYLEEDTDFFKAPASTRYHGSYEGGLVEHSIAVGTNAFNLTKVFPIDFSNESIAIVSLFHDLCKANFYKADTRNVKNEETGKWEKVPCYTVDEKMKLGGHGEKSAFIVMMFMKLTPEEFAAINCHMGFSNDKSINDVSAVYETNHLAWALHVADEAATYIDKV